MQTNHQAEVTAGGHIADLADRAVAILRSQVYAGSLATQPVMERIARELIAEYDGIRAVETVASINAECVVERARRGHA